MALRWNATPTRPTGSRKAAEIVPDAVRAPAKTAMLEMFRDGVLDPKLTLCGKNCRRPRYAGIRASVGATLGKIHAATANDDIVAERFATDEIFMRSA